MGIEERLRRADPEKKGLRQPFWVEKSGHLFSPAGRNVFKSPQGCSGYSSVAGSQRIAPRRQRRNRPVGKDKISRPVGRARNVRETFVMIKSAA